MLSMIFTATRKLSQRLSVFHGHRMFKESSQAHVVLSLQSVVLRTGTVSFRLS